MHSQTHQYTRVDTEFADDKRVREVNFHYNSDFSGEVIIENEIAVIRVPGWMLREVVGSIENRELIGEIEGWSGRETLVAIRRMLA